MSVRALLISAIFIIQGVLCQAAQAASVEIAQLGLTVETVTPQSMKAKGLAVSSGALITAVTAGGAAANAGLQPGDIIVAFNGAPVGDVETLRAQIKTAGSASDVRLVRIRGKADEAEVTISSLSPARPDDVAIARYEYAPAPRAVAPPKRKTRSFARKMAKPAPTAAPSPPPPPAAAESEPEAAEAAPQPAGAAPGVGEAKFTAVRVFYGTDRNRTQSTTPGDMYGSDRAQLSLGSCDVTIPKSHVEGEIEQPSWVSLEFSEDPEKHIILQSVKPLSQSDFYAQSGEQIASSPDKSAFIFVHGYNVTFRDAALRTAQISYDLKFKGAPVFFSWPSQGKYLGYVRDESNIAYAKTDLQNFLRDFAKSTPAEKIYLVAHSMGNRAVTAALGDLFREAPEIRSKFKEIILAAPDIDADIFRRDLAPAILGPDHSVTLYASSNDWALKASKTFHGYDRAGDSEKLTIVPGLVTIDSSAVETGLLGHSYFAESKSIIGDMLAIFAGRANPEERDYLISAQSDAGRYWKIPGK